MLILDIPCQQFEDKCKLEGFFVPFGHRDGKCIFIEISIYIGYMLPTIWRACYRCMLILDISCQKFGDNCKLGGFYNHINQSYQKPPGSIHQSHQ